MSGPAGPRIPSGTAATLESLLTDTLDPGYAAAARRRAACATPDDPGLPGGNGPHRRGGAGGRSGPSALLGLGAFLVGLLLVIAYTHAHRAAPADARTRADLRARVSAAQSDAAQLAKTVNSLQAAADARRSALLGGSSGQLPTAELQAAATAVRGPGLRVTIDNPPLARTSAPAGRAGTTPIGAVSILTDSDVRAIVNQLWAAGAEAVAVNTIRLASTSAIRFAGEVVLVDFQPVTAPYTISAVGDPDTLITDFTASAVADRFRTLSSAYGFGFTTSQEKDITLPASAVGDPRYAHLDSATPSAGPTS